MGSARPLSKRKIAWYAVSLGLGLVWTVWTLVMLAVGNGSEVEKSVTQAVDIARSLKSLPLQLLSAALLLFAVYRLYRARSFLALSVLVAMAASVQLRRHLDYSDRTLVIIVLIEVTVFMVGTLWRLASLLRQNPNSSVTEPIIDP